MNKLYCFLTINSFVNNSQNSTNPIGELSGISLTYAKDVKQYYNPQGYLSLFFADGVNVTHSNHIDEACQVISNALSPISTTNLNAAPLDKVGLLLTPGSGIDGYMENPTFTSGSYLNPVDGKVYPTRAEFQCIINNLTWEFVVFFSDVDFKDNYPKTVINVRYLIDMQLLGSNFPLAKQTFLNLNKDSILNGFSLSEPKPYTYSGTLSLTAYDKNNLGNTFNVQTWYAVNGKEVTTAEITDKVLSDLINGGIYPIEDWAIIIPELYPRNIFTITPLWNNTAISNIMLPNPICSPSLSLAEIDATVATYLGGVISDYPALDYSVAMYKSLGFFSIPNANNRNGGLSFRETFPDYFLISLMDINLEQMSLTTQEMVRNLERLLRAGETYINTIVLPSDLSVELAGNKTYLTKTFGQFKLRVLTKESVL